MSLTRDDVRAFCNEKISHFKIPRYVFNVDDFPRTLSGKIQKFKFPEVYKKEIEQAVEGSKDNKEQRVVN